MRVILDHGMPCRPSHVQNGVHLAANTGIVHRHNSPRAGCDEAFQLRLVQIKSVRPYS
jgi:hypothetical protein